MLTTLLGHEIRAHRTILGFGLQETIEYPKVA